MSRKPGKAASVATPAAEETSDLQLAPITGAEAQVVGLVRLELLRPGKTARARMDPDRLLELADSIRAQGVVEPLIVRMPQGPLDADSQYEIVAGHRRYEAARLAGVSAVPVIIRHLDDAAAAEVALIENLQREDLDAIEEARIFEGLLYEHEWTQDQLATKIGKSQPYIANRLRLLELPEDVRQAIAGGTLSAAAGIQLLRLREHPEHLARVAAWALQGQWSARQVDESVTSQLNRIKWDREWEERRAKEAAEAEARRAEREAIVQAAAAGDAKAQSQVEAEEAQRQIEEAERQRRNREWERRGKFVRTYVDTIVHRALDHLAPKATSPLLWAVAIAEIFNANWATHEERKRLYAFAGVEPGAEEYLQPYRTIPDSEWVRIVDGLVQQPLAEIRRAFFRGLFSHRAQPGLLELLYEALPDDGRAQVDAQVARAAEQIYGAEPAPPIVPLRQRIAQGCAVSDPFGELPTAADDAAEGDDEEPCCAVCGVTERELAASGGHLVVAEDADGELLCDECAADITADETEDGPACRVCGCTDHDGCPEGCFWVEDDLCSECATPEELAAFMARQQADGPSAQDDLPPGTADRPAAEALPALTDAVRWVLNNSVLDIGYRTNVPKLTDLDLLYCLLHEERKSGQSQLQREARRRGRGDLVTWADEHRGESLGLLALWAVATSPTTPAEPVAAVASASEEPLF